jgi:hypothetical protein
MDPGLNTNTCTLYGESYFHDVCGSLCTITEYTGKCDSTTPGCTADSSCNNVVPNTVVSSSGSCSVCSSSCVYTSSSCSSGTSSCSDDGWDNGVTCYYNEACTTSGYTAPSTCTMNDHCSGTTRLYSASCSGSGCSYSSENCATKATIDTDGGTDFYVGGILSDYSACSLGSCTPVNHADSCSTGNILTEYRPASTTSYSSTTWDCDNDDVYASDTDSGNDPLTSGSCTDGENWNCISPALAPSYCSGVNGNGNCQDTCGAGNVLTECYPNGIDCLTTPKDCDDYDDPSTDSDGGDVPGTAGTCTAGQDGYCYNPTGADRCATTSGSAGGSDSCSSPGGTLTEYYMGPNFDDCRSKTYTCANFEVAATGDTSDDPNTTATCTGGTAATCSTNRFTTAGTSSGTDTCEGDCGAGTCNFREYYATDSGDGCSGLDTCTSRLYDPDTNSNTCTTCSQTWLSAGTGTNNNCCGDDGTADDFEQTTGSGRSACLNGVVRASGWTSGAFLVYNGQIYSCNSASTFTFDTDHTTSTCSPINGYYCNADNTWKTTKPSNPSCTCTGGNICTSLLCVEGSCSSTCSSTASNRCSYNSATSYTTYGLCTVDGCDNVGEVAFDDTNYQDDCSLVGTTTADDDHCDPTAAGGEYSAAGTCAYGTAKDDANANCIVGGVICQDASGNLRDACSRCGSTTERACDSVSSTSYSPDGVCVSSGACDTDEVCWSGSNYVSDCSGCYSTGSGEYACDTDVSSTGDYAISGMCTSAGTCCTADVPFSSNFYCSCDGYGGKQCDTSTTDGGWTQNGMCFDDGGTTDGTNFDCKTSGYIFYDNTYYDEDIAVVASDYDADTDPNGMSCDSTLTPGDYSATGMVTSSGCTAAGSIVSKDEEGGNQFNAGCNGYGNDQCDSSIAASLTAPWGATGYCTDGDNACCAGNAVDNSRDGWGNAEDLCTACSATYNGDYCDSNAANGLTNIGVCAGTTCCTTDYVDSNNDASFNDPTCGCSAANNGKKCDTDPTTTGWDGICAVTNCGSGNCHSGDETWDCVTGSTADTCYDGTNYVLATASGRIGTDGYYCESGLIGSNGFNQEGLCVGSTCDTSNPTRMNCGAGDACTPGTDTTYLDCDSISGDSCDNTVTSGGHFSQDGTCTASGCDTSTHFCFDDTNFQSTCSSCSSTEADDDKCDSSVLGGDYVANGICTDSNICTLDGSMVYVDSSAAHALKAGCSSDMTGAVSDLDNCDSSLSSQNFTADGICTAAGECSTGVIYKASGGDLIQGCTNSGGEQCDSDATGSETSWATSATGVCITGSICDDDEVRNSCTYLSGSCGTYSSDCSSTTYDNYRCHRGVTDPSDYTDDGVCDAGNCVACTANEVGNCNDDIDNDCDGYYDYQDSSCCPTLSGATFTVKTPTTNCFKVDVTGDVRLKGSLTLTDTIASAPANSYVVKNSGGTVVWYIDSSCNMVITGQVYDNQGSIETSGSATYIRNTGATNLAKFDTSGNVYTLGQFGSSCGTV